MPRPQSPRYPGLRVSIRGHNPMALVAAVREGLRFAGAGRRDIRTFTEEALSRPDPSHVWRVAREWVGNIVHD